MGDTEVTDLLLARACETLGKGELMEYIADNLKQLQTQSSKEGNGKEKAEGQEEDEGIVVDPPRRGRSGSKTAATATATAARNGQPGSATGENSHGIFFHTPGGKVFHTSRECGSLKRSKIIHESAVLPEGGVVCTPCSRKGSVGGAATAGATRIVDRRMLHDRDTQVC